VPSFFVAAIEAFKPTAGVSVRSSAAREVTDEMFLAAKPRPANVLADLRAAMYEPVYPSYA